MSKDIASRPRDYADTMMPIVAWTPAFCIVVSVGFIIFGIVHGRIPASIPLAQPRTDTTAPAAPKEQAWIVTGDTSTGQNGKTVFLVREIRRMIAKDESHVLIYLSPCPSEIITVAGTLADWQRAWINALQAGGTVRVVDHSGGA